MSGPFSEWLDNERRETADLKAENEELRKTMAVICMHFSEGMSVTIPLDVLRRLPDYEFQYQRDASGVTVWWRRRPDPVVHFEVKENR